MPAMNERALGALLHNRNNAVTASITRVRHGAGTLVRKVLNGRNTFDTAPEWRASDDPRHWNYWRRELEVYRSDIPQILRDSGVRLPRLHAVEERSEASVTLLLEDIDGRSGRDLTLQDYVRVCGAWGHAQANLSRHDDLLEMPWTSTGFLCAYTTSKAVDYSLLYADAAWRAPLIAENWPPQLRARLVFLYENAERLYAILEGARQVPSHLDFWPNNVFVDTQGVVVPVDWAFFGGGALAEDLGNFIPDAVFDGFMPAAKLPEMTETLFAAYMSGLAAGGLDVDAVQLRRLLWASAVKYVWLGPLLLARAAEPEQRSYGGAVLQDANTQYRERGVALNFLGGWAMQALAT